MTVGQYEKFMTDPEEIILDILMEFNEKIPDLSTDEMKEFMKSVLSWSDGFKKNGKKSTGKEDPLDALKISKGMMMFHYHQQEPVIEWMAVRAMFEYLDDLAIVSGKEEYDPLRKSERVDWEWLSKLKGEL